METVKTNEERKQTKVKPQREEWQQKAIDYAVNGSLVFAQGALFTLGGMAVTKLAGKIAAKRQIDVGDNNVIPLKRTVNA